MPGFGSMIMYGLGPGMQFLQTNSRKEGINSVCCILLYKFIVYRELLSTPINTDSEALGVGEDSEKGDLKKEKKKGGGDHQGLGIGGTGG